jgi:hypothetical protein
MGEAVMWGALGQVRKSHGAIATTEVHDRGMPWAHAVALGLVPGCSRVSTLGTNPTTASGASFWYGTGPYNWIPSARTLEIVSSSASDTLAGTGSQKVKISGLDANYNQVSEIISLNGTTAVPTANQYLRVNQMINAQVGSGQVNAGNISLRDTGGGTLRCIIPIVLAGIGIGISSQSAYTVPAGYTLLVESAILSINRNTGNTVNNVTVRSWLRSSTGVLVLPLSFSTSSNLPYRHEAGNGYPLLAVAEKTDTDFYCTDVSNAVSVTASWVGALVQNSTVLAN